MSDDYKEDLKIDFFNLHLNYRDQASNFMEWSEKWANAVRERDRRKRWLRIDIRKDPEKYDLPSNPSAAAINGAIDEDEELIELTKDRDILYSVKEAFNQRKFAIDGLVRLYLNGYYSGPHPATTRVKEERGERVRQAQHEGLQHSKRIGGRKHGIRSQEEDESAERGSSTSAQGEYEQE